MRPLTGSREEPPQAPWQQYGLNDHFFIKADLARRSLWQIFPQPSSNGWTADIYVTAKLHTCGRRFHAAHGSFHAEEQERLLLSFPRLNRNSSFREWPHPLPGLRDEGRKHAARCSGPGFLLRLLRARDWPCWVLNWWNGKNSIPMK